MSGIKLQSNSGEIVSRKHFRNYIYIEIDFIKRFKVSIDVKQQVRILDALPKIAYISARNYGANYLKGFS